MSLCPAVCHCVRLARFLNSQCLSRLTYALSYRPTQFLALTPTLQDRFGRLCLSAEGTSCDLPKGEITYRNLGNVFKGTPLESDPSFFAEDLRVAQDFLPSQALALLGHLVYTTTGGTPEKEREQTIAGVEKGYYMAATLPHRQGALAVIGLENSQLQGRSVVLRSLPSLSTEFHQALQPRAQNYAYYPGGAYEGPMIPNCMVDMCVNQGSISLTSLAPGSNVLQSWTGKSWGLMRTRSNP